MVIVQMLCSVNEHPTKAMSQKTQEPLDMGLYISRLQGIVKAAIAAYPDSHNGAPGSVRKVAEAVGQKSRHTTLNAWLTNVVSGCITPRSLVFLAEIDPEKRTALELKCFLENRTPSELELNLVADGKLVEDMFTEIVELRNQVASLIG